MSKAIGDVVAERVRQQVQEGFTDLHDDLCTTQLRRAAVCYIEANPDISSTLSLDRPKAWPWHTSWWKPTDRRRNLIKAAALLIAEIERLDRIEQKQQQQLGEKSNG